ncbi:MAG TPA: 2-succinyl-5-enolpyruvyl-6-hydroxy-3-cyclohexene-1-carboxylic-acid synthase [Pseudonocardiaceae bacterium]|nr:2-succinyl-5-enolpyruvyl-6-hydroxy-3-cyclohexene-1-carboxylic-acid synthase [Pseudonocardiaceae bacterium]
MLNPSTALARVIVDELARGGVREAVIAPGSRSAPLAIAFAGHPGIRAHVRIDERSAAFLGLGLAKMSGIPVPIVCTSGTAAANFHPAVLEASHAHVPLMVLTADRPPELRGTGANQTVDQLKLYGDAVRFFTDLGVAEARPGMTAYWRSVICRALRAARGQGPVHLNVPFREPLVPDPADQAWPRKWSREWPEPLEGRPAGQPWTAAPVSPVADEPVPELAEPPERGILVAGDGAGSPRYAVAFAEAAGWPIFAEPASGARLGPHAITTYSQLLAIPAVAEGYRPELIVTVGKPGLAKSLLALYPHVRHIVVDPNPDWADPTRTAMTVLPALPELARTRDPSEWLRTWQRMETAARDELDRILDRDAELSELRLARDVAELAGPNALLFAGSSMPVRCLDLAMRAGEGPWVLANRGVSGIDGCVSSALGAAIAHQAAGGGPSFALLGDLAVIHDQNGLVIGPGEARPDLAVAVVNNDGGGIFSLLPYAGMEQFEKLFGTPHGVDFAHMAAATGWEHHNVTTPDELPAALKGGGTRLIEVRTDRQASAVFQRQVREALTAAVSALLGA